MVAITRKPKLSGTAYLDVDALINKGGSQPTHHVSDDEDMSIAVVLRIPAPILKRVDVAVKARPIRTPRHTWLLEAIHEKLCSEADNG